MKGFHMYWFQDLVDNAPNQEYEMYMTMQFNNAVLTVEYMNWRLLEKLNQII